MIFLVGFCILLKVILVENRMLPNDLTVNVSSDTSIQRTTTKPENNAMIPEFHSIEAETGDFYKVGEDRSVISSDEEIVPSEDKTKRPPCAIIVVSNILNPSMQSLLRKYRYDANGILIPSSVQYFLKLPQGIQASPILVPLNDKAFSPSGGFVRYYKEVPPIPHSWKR